ncbi:helix-turn-helix transcriptional regulator [bacterium]|nr:helix-turn-helix transcriptional regulator [bacterium]
MNLLSKIEEILLLTIWKLNDGAYGVAIFEQIEKETDMRWMSGSIYGALTRLKKNDYVSIQEMELHPGQGGRPRIYYQLTPLGFKRLTQAQKINQSLWTGVPFLEESK